MDVRYPIDGSRDALWMATAVPAPETTTFSADASCDVAIIGAGLTGLNAALELSSKGVSVTVLDSATIGFGASGRSGGQVNLGLNAGPEALLKMYGTKQTERLIDLVVKTPQSVFDLISQHELNCDAVQNGWVQSAANARILKTQEAMAAEYNEYGDCLQVIDAEQLSDISGANGYVGGLHCKSAGSLQPLSYTRELARVCLAKGVKVHSNSAVTGIDKADGNWSLRTASATLQATTVLVCTNGYTTNSAGKATSDLERTLVPVRSVLAATEPLSDNLRKTILPNQLTFVDKRRLILYMRYDRDGRLCVGDHGPMRDAFSLEDFNNVKRRALKVFPQLVGVRWDYHWGGRIAITKNGLPFMHEIAPGLIAGMGFNGRGVGMGSMMGRELARYALHGDQNASGFPLTTPSTFTMHRFHSAGVSMSVKWFALMDYLDSVR